MDLDRIHHVRRRVQTIISVISVKIEKGWRGGVKYGCMCNVAVLVIGNIDTVLYANFKI